MALLNLPPANGTRRRRKDEEAEGSLAGLAERMNALAAQQKQADEERSLAQQQADQEKAKEDERKAAEERAKEKTLIGKLAGNVADIFQADSEGDKARRKAAGQPEKYADQKAEKKKTAEGFTADSTEEFERGKLLNFSKDEIDARREHYKSRGLDIDQLVKDKQSYDTLVGKYGGDTRKVALARAKGELPEDVKNLEESAKRFEDTKTSADKAEDTYQRNKRVEAGAEGALGQIERGFVRGAAEPLVSLPGSLKTIAGAVGEAVAPEGSRLEKGATKLRESGEEDREEIARRIAEAGYTLSPNDNPALVGVGQGAGSIVSSLGAAGAAGRTSAAAALFGVQAGTEQLTESKKAGKGDVQSLLTGVGAGIAEGLLEKVGLDKFLGVTGAPLKQAGKRMLTEGTQEVLQSLSQSGIKATYTDVDLGEALQQAFQEGGIGALVGGGASFPMSVAQTLQAKGVDPDTALEAGMNAQERVQTLLEEERTGFITQAGTGQDVQPTTVPTTAKIGQTVEKITTGRQQAAAEGKPKEPTAASISKDKPTITAAEAVRSMPMTIEKGVDLTKYKPEEVAWVIADKDAKDLEGIKVVQEIPSDARVLARDDVGNMLISQQAASIEGEAPIAEETPKGTLSKTPGKPVEKQPVQESRARAGRQEALDALADYDKTTTTGRESARSAEELVNLADKLNKAAQAGAILRRGDYKSKKNLGAFERKKKKGVTTEEVIKLQDAVIKNPRMYATVLAHEMSHAIEHSVNGNTKSTLKLFGTLTKEEEAKITEELKAVVNEIEGADIAAAKPEYYYKPTEMLARYIETIVLHPGQAEHLAPLTTEKFGQLVVSEPMVADLFAALDDSLDKGFKNYTPSFLKDLRQMYRQQLGKRAGDVAYNAEVIRRAEIQRSQTMIDKLVKQKFKDVKDKPEQLFRAAEAVRITKGGEPEFGTHDFLNAVTEKEIKALEETGWERVGPASDDGQEGFVYTRVRYTPEQAEKIFKELSPEGQQLIKDFTAAKEEAKDEFNRELMKDIYKIDSKLEGWVHHYFEGTPMAGSQKTGLRTKVASARKHRKGAEGYIEDFQKATEKALLELDRAEINNDFIRKQLARISKPIAKGDKPEKGWVEVVADERGGLRLPGEGNVMIIQADKNAKGFKLPEKRYQVPRALADHYREIRDLPAEASMAGKFFNAAGKYWAINVLTHPGTASTNFISGALQYASKIMNDFYLDLLTANFGMERTRHNLMAPIKTLTPRGWSNAPDWLYGGYRSTWAGQFATGDETGDTRLDRGLDAYGNKVLKVFGLVETYWKKVLATSERSHLSPAAARRISDRLHKDEQQMVTELNKVIDEYAFDYDNKPLWMSKFDRHGGKLVKPFMTYPYKLTKFYTGHIASAFDRTLPWQQRTAKVLTMATLVTFIAMLYNRQEDESEVPAGTEKTPLSFKPGGRLFVGVAKSGQELFVRTAKYPWLNLTSMGKAAFKRDGTEVLDLLREQFGTLGPGAELFLLATGRKDQFSQYTPVSVILAEQAGTFIPGFRISGDIAKMFDDTARKPGNFLQSFITAGLPIPLWGSEETREKLRGEPRTIKIPDEAEEGRSVAKSERSITTREIENYRGDVLMSLLTGIYVRRIDPKEARQQELREVRDDAEEAIRQLLEAGNEAEADAIGEAHGLDIPESVKGYYRSKRRR